jgi:hypothetical protein
MTRPAITSSFSALQGNQSDRLMVSDETEHNRPQSGWDYAQRSSNRDTFQPIGIGITFLCGMDNSISSQACE